MLTINIEYPVFDLSYLIVFDLIKSEYYCFVY